MPYNPKIPYNPSKGKSACKAYSPTVLDYFHTSQAAWCFGLCRNAAPELWARATMNECHCSFLHERKQMYCALNAPYNRISCRNIAGIYLKKYGTTGLFSQGRGWEWATGTVRYAREFLVVVTQCLLLLPGSHHSHTAM